MVRFVSLLMLVFVSSIACAQQQEPDRPSTPVFSKPSANAGKLRWQFKPGETLHLVMEQMTEQELKVGAAPVKSGSKTTTWMNWKVDSVDDKGNAKITSVIDRIQMELDSPMGKVSIDTDKKEKEAQGDTDAAPSFGIAAVAKQIRSSVTPMVGASFTQRMSPLGKISDVVIPKEVKLATAGPMGNMESMIKGMSESASPGFPSDSLKLGQTWTIESENKSPVGAIGLKNTYTYLGTTKIKGKELHTLQLDIKMDFKGGTVEMGDQSTTGYLHFDGNLGRLAGSEVKQDADMTIKAAGQTMKQKLKTTTKTTVTSGS